MLHKNTDITLVVKENRPETPGYRSIVFARPQNFKYEPGDWIDLVFPGKGLKGGTTYSLASSPTEPDLMITLKDGVSELKTGLANVANGDALRIVQYGNSYKFTLQPDKSSTLIAGGVGIAPFRSMLREIVDTNSKNVVNVLYLNQTADFLFKAEFDTWSSSVPTLKINYIVTKCLKKKDRTNAMLAAIQTTDQLFYIAGPPGMVESTEHMLIDQGVMVNSIRIDSFGGY